jgi:hypothetical protein
MIHPSTELRYIDAEIGSGVFATSFIPKGTVTFVKDHLDVNVSPLKYSHLNQQEKDVVDKYSYIESNGNRVVSWDHGKFVNHCCNPNSMSTGYGFEIAIKDIQIGEQITDEYGLFNVDYPMTVNCGQIGCRGVITSGDIDLNAERWDSILKDALLNFKAVNQPLGFLLSKKTNRELDQFLIFGRYKSVTALKLKETFQVPDMPPAKAATGVEF